MKMIVQQERELEVILTLDNRKEIADNLIREIFNIPYSNYLFIDDENNLCNEVEIGAGSHSYFEERKLRKLSKDDKSVLDLLKKIKKYESGT